MSHTICRFKKIRSTKDLTSAEVHNARLYEQLGFKVPENIKKENEGLLGFNHHELWMEGKSMLEAVESRLSKLAIQPRKDSVIAHEYVLGVSKDWYEKANYTAPGMLMNLMQFIVKKYGEENIVSTSTHFDESTPHIHIIALPIVKKERKWKNRNGSGIKVTYGLSGSDFINGRETLRKLQEDFYSHARQWNRGEGIIRRGLLSEVQTKEYTEKTNHLLGELRELTKKIGVLVTKISEGEEIQKHKKELSEEQRKYNELLKEIDDQQNQISKSEKRTKYRKDQNKDGGWMKGLEF